ncbi:methyl-accepting chemotaxis protein [Brevibacillus humidisoli]|uniref:methyl-accepting chemotaxis protein n=1 Tax=Brevibacillus humidisoli TaxID=2895522 RepID=UPI001E4E8BE4|nr:methyl-accepting chemotaxis protein [Brevibacillus humidisoli]UFJ41085.1 methyl-accepting chemotaxis protein [Brevibacillus humidisoli]
MNLLQNVVKVSSLMHGMVLCFEDDFTLGVTDTEKFLAYLPGKSLRFGLSPEDPIKEGSLAHIVMRQGEAISKVMDSSVYGVAYVAGGLPILEDGKVTGSLVFGVSMDRQNKLAEIAEHLSAIVEEVNAQSQMMRDGAEALSSHSEKQYHVMTNMLQQVQATSSVLQSISQIAKQSEILGLNASIEAARAGEHGKGFTIVAKEMRRLATMSGDLAKQIAEHLSALQTEMSAISEMALDSKNLSKAQTEGIIELASAIQEVTEESILLQQMSQIKTTTQA